MQESVRDITQIYLNEIENKRLLSASEEKILAKKVKRGDKYSRQKMIESNLRLVIKIAKRYQGYGIFLADLVGEGNLGLIHALEKFDPSKGFRFSTYATWWVKRFIKRALGKQAIRVSLSTNGLNENNFFIKELESNITENNYSQLEQEKLEEIILYCLAQLPIKYKEIVVKRFGLLGGDAISLKKVAEKTNLTPTRVRQIQINALKLLKNLLEQEGYSNTDFI